MTILGTTLQGDGYHVGIIPSGSILSGSLFTPSSDTTGVADYTALSNKAGVLSALGGGTIHLDGGEWYINAPLPIFSNVVYEGAGWKITGTGIIDLYNVTKNGGTWINAVGAVAYGFEYNSTDGVAAMASVGAYTAATAVNLGVRNLGLSGFSGAGIKIGSNFNPGAAYSEFHNLCALNCGWGFWFENMVHVRYDRLNAFGNTVGQIMFRSSSTSSIYQPANCRVGEIVATVPNTSPKVRGIVIENANGTIGGLAQASIIQCNRFSPATSTQAATMAAASTAIGLPDLSKFMVGMPVTVSATANGFTQNKIYIIKTMTAATGAGSITLADYRNGTEIAATGNTAVNIITQGMPCLEMVPADATGGNAPALYFAGTLDLEAGGTTKFYAENLNGGMVATLNTQNSGSTQDVCIRNSNSGVVMFAPVSTPNLDLSVGSFSLIGNARGTNSLGDTPIGANGQPASSASFNLAKNFGGETATFQNKLPGFCDVTYPGVPLGQRANQKDTGTTTLAANNFGSTTYNGAGGVTWTLPNSSAALLGIPAEIINTGAGTLTLATNGTELFNNKAALTSINIGTKASLTVRLQKTSGGTYYWAIIAVGGTYAAGVVTGL